MIFAYYDENGILKETITKPVRVGDDGYDKVCLFFAGKDYDPSINAYPANVAEGSTITSTFRNSGDGIESLETFSDTEILSIPFDPERDLRFFRYYTNYQFYVAEVPTSVLATAGSVSCTPRQIYGDSEARAYGTLVFPVEGGVVIADHAITSSEYNYLLNHISVGAVFYPNVSAEGIISWTNEMGIPNPPARDIAGPGIESIEKISGTGAPGTTDTYRISYAGGRTADFSVYNGKDGKGVKAQEITDNSAFASFVAAHYDEIVACFIAEADTQHLDVTHFCQIVRDEYADDPEYGTRTEYRIVYTDYDGTSQTETTSLNALPNGATLTVFYGQESADDSLKMFTSGESHPSYERRHVEKGDAKASLIAESTGGSLVVTDSAGTSSTAYKKGAIRNGLYDLTLPEKNGTIATLGDVISSDYAFNYNGDATGSVERGLQIQGTFSGINVDAKAILEATTAGGLLKVTNARGTSTTRFYHNLIQYGSYYLSFPTKSGTLATLSDIPAQTKYVYAIESAFYKDNYYFLPNEWEDWLQQGSKAWDVFLAALGLTTAKGIVYVRVAYGNPFASNLYNTRGYVVRKSYSGGTYLAVGELHDPYVEYMDSEGVYRLSVSSTMSGTSIYSANASPFTKIADLTDYSRSFTSVSENVHIEQKFWTLQYNDVYVKIGATLGGGQIQISNYAGTSSAVYTNSYINHGVIQNPLPDKSGTFATIGDAFNYGDDSSSIKVRELRYDASSDTPAVRLYANSTEGALFVRNASLLTYLHPDKIEIDTGGPHYLLTFPLKTGTLATTDDISGGIYSFNTGYNVSDATHDIKSRTVGPSDDDPGAVTLRYDTTTDTSELRSGLTVNGRTTGYTSYQHAMIVKDGNIITLPSSTGTLALTSNVPHKRNFSCSSLADGLDQVRTAVDDGVVMIEALLWVPETEGGQTVTNVYHLQGYEWDGISASATMHAVGWVFKNGFPQLFGLTYNAQAGTLTIKYAYYQ